MQIRPLVTAAITIALAGFVATGCGGKDGVLGIGGIPDNAVCTVDGESISKAQYDRLYDQSKQQYVDAGKPLPKKGSDEYRTVRDRVLGTLIDQQLFAQQSDKFGIEITDKDIDKRLKQLKKNNFKGDEKKFKSEMKRVGYTIKDVRNDLALQLQSEELYRQVTKDIEVSDTDIKNYYDENPKNYEVPEKRDVAHILIPKDKALATKLYGQVKGGDEKLFAKLAKQYSEDDGSKENGGKLTITRGETVPEFDKAAFDLETGEVSPPVKTRYGYHVIMALSDTTPLKKKSLKEVSGEIEGQLLQQERSDRYQEWLKNVKKDAEDDVECRKGYSWTQTQTQTQQAPAAPAPAPVEAPKADSSSGDSGGDAKGAGDKAKSKDAGAKGSGSDASK